MSGANGCRGASWSEQLDGKELRGALGGERDQEPRGSPFSGHRLHGQPPFFIYYSVVYWFLKCRSCIAVLYHVVQ